MRGRRTLRRLRAAWGEFGLLGRIAFLGVVMSGLVAVSLGFLIPRMVRDHMIDGRIGELERAAEAVLFAAGDPGSLDSAAGLAEFGTAATALLLGGDIVRVKVWSADGEIVWSDEERLVGRTFPVAHDIAEAFAGSVSVERADTRDPENLYEREFGSLLEFYLPLRDQEGDVTAVFEVYQRAGPVETTLRRVRASTWLGIGSGLIILSVFMGVLTLVTVRGVERRREESEELLTMSIEARELERARLVSALHDDVGQPLYRLLYGLEALESNRLAAEDAAQEARRLATLVRQVDSTLRDEMRRLGTTRLARQGLAASLRQLESDRTEVAIEGDPPISPIVAEALFRAAREAVTNSEKHSGAENIRLATAVTGGEIAVEVTDDGTWRPGPPRLGLATARQLLSAVGGRLEVRTSAAGGTTVIAFAPLEPDS